jgi:hypothetical protein
MLTVERAMVVAKASAWPRPAAPSQAPAVQAATDGFPTALVLRVVRSVPTASLAGNAYLHAVAPMAAATPPAVLPRRVDGPAHRHGLRTHSTPSRGAG